ncbi:SpaA isopeptide-forming pilin-related protein, partial [Alkalibacterium kapii]|uniref:SpaA isopeptide-forming pilin-related protein n=1 Tax=Alkalibacterium kapii TaxID=426704 RepID=UPI0024821869
SNYSLKLLEEDGTEFTGYTIDYTAPEVENPGQFVITFTESIERPLTLNYSTHFERNSDGTASYRNQATINWSEGGKDYTSDSGEISSGDTGLTAVNGVKNGRYNAVTKEITWSVYANYARLPIKDDFEISDVLPEHQEWVTDSFDVFSYEVNAKGNIINEESLDASFYTLTFTEGEDPAFSLKLSDSMNNKKQAVGIRFSTEFSDGWVRDAKVINKAKVVNNNETIDLEAGVKIPFGGVFADKDGVQTGEFSERIDWEISLNPNRSIISDFKLTDNPDLNSRLMKDTFVLYEAKVNKNGDLSKTDNVLTEGEDYNLNIMANQETGKQSFELSFPEKIDQAYILTYSSYIDPLVNKDDPINNAFTAEGTTTEYQELTEDEVNVFKNNAGGGDGSSVRGNLEIRKVDTNGKDLSGATFQLFTKNGEQLLRSGETNQEGHVTFGGLRRGDYLLKEVKAPERYVISPELAEGKEITLDHENDQDVVIFDAVNRLTQVKVTKMSTDGPIRSDVVFSILDENKNVIREKVTAEKGQLVIEDLDPGSYFLKEERAPEGYILNTALVPFKVQINENGTQQVPELKVMNYKGSVAFEKTDADGKALSGVEFEIRNQDNETIRTLETDKSGKVSATDLVPGEYTVHETKAAEGYILDTTVRRFVIEDEQEGKPETIQLNDWTNYQGSVRLIKMDEQKNLLEGATFELRQGETVIAEETTDAEGQLTVTGLAPGSYTFVEVASPDGFILNSDPVDFAVAAKEAGEPELIILDDFINYKGKAFLNKVDASGDPLEEAAFELRDVDGLLIEGNLVSDENGEVHVNGLAPGSYAFVETKAPEGYILNTEGDFSFTIEAVQSGQVEAIDAGELVNYKGTAELIKTDVNEEPLADAEFALENAEGEIVQEKLVADENGKVSVTELASGDYTLIETKAPKGYMLNTQTVPFTIVEKANGEPEALELGTFINYQGSVQLEKVNQAGDPLGEATFELYDNSGELVETLTTNADGKLLSGPLAPGNYTLEEINAPEDYIINEEVLRFTIEKENNGKPQPNDLGQFINYQGNAEFIKTDAEGKILEGAHFSLYKGEEVVSDNLVTDEEGKIVVENLSPGQYVLKETKPLDGYILNTETIAFEISDSDTGEPVRLDLGKFVNYKGAVRLQKADKQGLPLEGAEFELLHDETVLSTHTTNENGEITVDGLAPGNYNFVETKAPEGFSINTTLIDFEILAENEGEPTVVTLDEFVNYRGQAVFEKTDSKGNPLSGAVFELRDSDGYLIEDSLESNDEGLVYAKDLAPGSYRFVEIEAPEGYVLNTEETDFFTIDASFEGERPVVDAGTLINYKGSVKWTKTDAEGNPLENAVFKLTDSEGAVVENELHSDANGQITVDGLVPGEYTLAETKAPNGFILNTETVTFEVEAQAEGEPDVQTLSDWINYQGSLEIRKTDTFDASLEGAVFSLIDSNDQVLYDNLVTDSEGRVRIEGLVPGVYTLVEIQAPEGYVLAENPVALTITDEHAGKPETVTVQVENEKVEETPSEDEESDSNDTLPQTSVSSFALLTKVMGIALLTVGLYVIRKQTKKN